jgi:hypothetical protein
MADTTLARIESQLHAQQKILSELVDMALVAVKESTDSSVSAIHLETRLVALADSMKATRTVEARPAPAVTRIRTRQ